MFCSVEKQNHGCRESILAFWQKWRRLDKPSSKGKPRAVLGSNPKSTRSAPGSDPSVSLDLKASPALPRTSLKNKLNTPPLRTYRGAKQRGAVKNTRRKIVVFRSEDQKNEGITHSAPRA